MSREQEKEHCECHDWATLNVQNMLLTGHHENCSKRVIKPEKALLDLVSALVEGMNAWGQDCDGIHPDAWEAYVKANAVLLQALKHNVVD